MGVPNVRCAPIAQARSTFNGVDLGFGIVGLLGLIGVLFTPLLIAVGLIKVAALTPVTLQIWAVGVIASCLMLINLIHKAMDLVFHYKLACIDGERCAVGQVVKILLNPDGDTSFGLKLAPIQDWTTLDDFKQSAQGESLVYSDPGTATRGWAFRPELGDGPVSDTQPIPLLHCEVKGSYLNDWLTALLALLWSLVALAVAAIALATLQLIPVFGWIIWAVTALALFFASLFGIHMAGDESGQGSATPGVPLKDQVPGANGPLLTDASNNKVAVGDFVILTGLHVLDCGHAEDKDGPGTWCELHPVRAIAKVDRAFYDDFSKGLNQPVADRYCTALLQAAQTDERTATAQQPLEHPRIG